MTDPPSRPPGVLADRELRALLGADPPLVSGLEDATAQVQPNGLDLRLESVWLPEGAGRLGRVARVVPPRQELPFDTSGWLDLQPGAYVVRLCETVNLPADVMALGFARSSLPRSGCSVLNAVWDAGYHGRSEVLLVVVNPAGFQVERGARILQLVFFRLAVATGGYRGRYQGENRER